MIDVFTLLLVTTFGVGYHGMGVALGLWDRRKSKNVRV
jgi:hypothetical protein